MISINRISFYWLKKLMALSLCLFSFMANAQNNEVTLLLPQEPNIDSVKKGNFPKQALEKFQQLNISGYYRFVTNYRHLNEMYSHLAGHPNNIFVGDDSQIPQLMLNINGAYSKNTSFGTDLYMWSPMTGAGQLENVKGLNLGISLHGNFSTMLGDFAVHGGGINWYSLTPFTFQANKGYNRYSLFERNPWDPNTKNIDSRYNEFYNSGAINQDARWGQQAFQGIIVEGDRMPHDFSGAFMYGKTQLNGGLSPIPNNSIGGKLKKNYKNNFISLNTFNNVSFADSTEKERVGFNIISEASENFFKNGYAIKTEIGAGRAFVQDSKSNWGEMVSIKLLKDIASKFPTEIHLYRISPHVFNNSSVFINSSIDQSFFSKNTSTQPVLPSVSSAMTNIGQLVNNRQGIDINSQINFGRFKSSIGWSASQELEKISPTITYSHPANSLVLAHFWRWDFPSNVGPYNNLSKIYRTVYETLYITDIDNNTGLPLYKKHFNSIELNSKWSGNIFHKPFYIFYLGQFSSAQYNFSPIPVFSQKSLLRTYYHQLDAYVKLSSSIVWTNYIGYERIIANYQTNTDVVSRRPKNQTGYSLATGFDLKLSKGCGLYFRQRWMKYFDSSFAKDKYDGYETTVELKIFF